LKDHFSLRVYRYIFLKHISIALVLIAKKNTNLSSSTSKSLPYGEQHLNESLALHSVLNF